MNKKTGKSIIECMTCQYSGDDDINESPDFDRSNGEEPTKPLQNTRPEEKEELITVVAVADITKKYVCERGINYSDMYILNFADTADSVAIAKEAILNAQPDCENNVATESAEQYVKYMQYLFGIDKTEHGAPAAMPETVDKCDLKGKNIFVIHPVNDITDKMKAAIQKYVADLEARGARVYDPMRDTDQSDIAGIDIYNINKHAIDISQEVHVMWDGVSPDCLFNIGMCFALDKHVVIVEELFPPPVEDKKSFVSMMRAWSDFQKSSEKLLY